MKTGLYREILEQIRVRPSGRAVELARRYGYRAYMVERYIEILGLEEAEELLRAFEKPLKPVVRCNDLRIGCGELAERLELLGFRLKHIPWSIHGYRVIESPRSPSIGATHEYLKGYYYVHRDAAPLIPGLLLTWGGYRGAILDAFAAPGGKATQMAQLMRDRGLIVANDLALYRIRALIGHTVRMGYRSINVTWSNAESLPRRLGRRFKRILYDVPCSGEGTIMFDPGRKTRTTIEDLAGIVEKEIRLLEKGIQLLDDDGILAYSTCSIAPEENELVIHRILRDHPELRIIKPPIRLFDWDPWLPEYRGVVFPEEYRYCIRTWPHRHGMMGFTTCLLGKR